MQWEQIYAELLNKIRWAIASTAAGQGYNYTYQDSIALATVLSGDALKFMKLKEEKPDLRATAKEIRTLISASTG